MTTKRPSWIKAKAPDGAEYRELKRLMESSKLHTVCQSAHCPNIGECWRARTATFMILGNTCTRNCRFCAVSTGAPDVVDVDEPRRVAEAVAHLGLKHAVITSVTRDDLSDGGAGIFAETIRLIHRFATEQHAEPVEARSGTPAAPYVLRQAQDAPGAGSVDPAGVHCSVEVLIPDLQGNWDALSSVVQARPEILNHNIETVERIYSDIRPQAIYSRSMELIRQAKVTDPDMRTKSGLMVGVGESWDELLQTMRDLRSVGCDILTIGQYLAPSKDHHPISRYYTPEEFDDLKRLGLEMGFGYVESAPLVRSSYHAAKQVTG